MNDYIEIKNARIHNLKGIDIKIPRNKLTVITGVSGSGKSSLAFDTLYEEGKKRYLMFSGTQFMVDTAETFDSMTGLSPTVAVEQRIIRQSNPRSTVGTRTKIGNMIAMLYATYGVRDGEYDDGLPLSMECFLKNSPKGMCVKCLGKGIVYKVNEEALFSDTSVKLNHILGDGKTHLGGFRRRLLEFCSYHGLSVDQTIGSLDEDSLMLLKYGDGGKTNFAGVIGWILQAVKWSKEKDINNWLAELKCVSLSPCKKCNGTGLGEQASHATIGGKTISELENMYISDLCNFLSSVDIKKTPLFEDIIIKLRCLIDVKLHHLALSRPVPTLSGGEIQRLFLASYIIAEMDSIIFVFDEPTIGLHEVEKENLIAIIKNLVSRGNTVIAVEHDENFMRKADYIVDLGPKAGIYGGERIFQGNFHEFLECNNSNTAPYLREENNFQIKTSFKPVNPQKVIKITNATLHNLQNVTTEIPLGLMVGIAGVSGSGKSSLISDTLVPKLKELLKMKCMAEDDEVEEETDISNVVISGIEHIKKCFVIDQRPIGRSSTSCPATYTGIFDRVRALFARESGQAAGLFTVNSIGGCSVCKGNGVTHYHVGYGNFIAMECETCSGTGFIPEALEVTIDGKNIRDILNMTIDEAVPYFKTKDKLIENILETLRRVGMGYIKLGQKTPTISGGESQRIKLAKELAKGQKATDNVYILDEPTTGLSFYDSVGLMKLMEELVKKGNTVIVTEHDPYVLSNCDYIIEMGIGGGSDGGNVIATGTPTDLRYNKNSIIGGYLK